MGLKNGSYDGFIHNDHLCLFPENLMHRLKSTRPEANKKEVASDLLAKKALKKDTDGNNAKQVNAAGNRRFYWISLGRL